MIAKIILVFTRRFRFLAKLLLDLSLSRLTGLVSDLPAFKRRLVTSVLPHIPCIQGTDR
jgi:hypothetical protein